MRFLWLEDNCINIVNESEKRVFKRNLLSHLFSFLFSFYFTQTLRNVVTGLNIDGVLECRSTGSNDAQVSKKIDESRLLWLKDNESEKNTSQNETLSIQFWFLPTQENTQTKKYSLDELYLYIDLEQALKFQLYQWLPIPVSLRWFSGKYREIERLESSAIRGSIYAIFLGSTNDRGAWGDWKLYAGLRNCCNPCSRCWTRAAIYAAFMGSMFNRLRVIGNWTRGVPCVHVQPRISRVSTFHFGKHVNFNKSPVYLQPRNYSTFAKIGENRIWNLKNVRHWQENSSRTMHRSFVVLSSLFLASRQIKEMYYCSKKLEATARDGIAIVISSATKLVAIAVGLTMRLALLVVCLTTSSTTLLLIVFAIRRRVCVSVPGQLTGR